jgi:hypothetical protein
MYCGLLSVKRQQVQRNGDRALGSFEIHRDRFPLVRMSRDEQGILEEA